MKLVFATNNLNKIKEVQRLIPEHIQLLSLEAIGCFEDVPETQTTIEGNAIQKAEYIKNHMGLTVLRMTQVWKSTHFMVNLAFTVRVMLVNTEMQMTTWINC